jgi:hypothetical protein
VVPQRTRDLVARLCAIGQVTEYTEYEGAGHGDIAAVSADQVTAWVADRFAGVQPTDSCAESEPPDEVSIPSTTPTPVAPAAPVTQTSTSPSLTG